ncbi:YceD family protein [Isoptericola sp. b441]|uniref:YceD family protein n=1 Tax=Actinotalea lenta TaxID=3064654 RepID=A0ABT9DF64_9CELL|nr:MULTISPECIES: YceD family protein [unclassified Isoptericola]MDO8108162.1 YceD family protein [Isoptericola sp. b441]MDO8120167.1 YceD family protein [Isoptericola sp. b490]
MEHHALDPRAPFVLDTHELGRRPGTMRTVTRNVPAPEDLGTAVIGVPAGSDLELDLRLEAVMEGILVSGTVRGGTVGECVRCLDEVVGSVDVPIQELYVYPERAEVAVEDGDDEEDLRELGADDLIDLEPAVRDTVVPALPFRPLCSPDCPGLCPQCGARLADPANAGHTHEVVDPRWAALADLYDDPKES